MPSINQPTLKIQLVAGSSQVDVTATVSVSFTAFDQFLIEKGLRFRVRCLLRGADSGFNGADDDLTYLPTKVVTAPGTVTFTARLPKSVLDEDWGTDEVYARFSLESLEAIVPFARAVNSKVITGRF